jgi:hypothetical protein
MTHIKVPKTPRSAFNPDRPASALLIAHVMHLEHALGLPERSPKKRLTEGAAARYIGELTARLTGQPPPVAATKGPNPKPTRKPRSKASRPTSKPPKAKRPKAKRAKAKPR